MVINDLEAHIRQQSEQRIRFNHSPSKKGEKNVASKSNSGDKDAKRGKPTTKTSSRWAQTGSLSIPNNLNCGSKTPIPPTPKNQYNSIDWQEANDNWPSQTSPTTESKRAEKRRIPLWLVLLFLLTCPTIGTAAYQAEVIDDLWRLAANALPDIDVPWAHAATNSELAEALLESQLIDPEIDSQVVSNAYYNLVEEQVVRILGIPNNLGEETQIIVYTNEEGFGENVDVTLMRVSTTAPASLPLLTAPSPDAVVVEGELKMSSGSFVLVGPPYMANEGEEFSTVYLPVYAYASPENIAQMAESIQRDKDGNVVPLGHIYGGGSADTHLANGTNNIAGTVIEPGQEVPYVLGTMYKEGGENGLVPYVWQAPAEREPPSEPELFPNVGSTQAPEETNASGSAITTQHNEGSSNLAAQERAALLTANAQLISRGLPKLTETDLVGIEPGSSEWIQAQIESIGMDSITFGQLSALQTTNPEVYQAIMQPFLHAEQVFDVPYEILLALVLVEKSGVLAQNSDLNSLRFEIVSNGDPSSADALGAGQIVPQTWNGWAEQDYPTDQFRPNTEANWRIGGVGTAYDALSVVPEVLATRNYSLLKPYANADPRKFADNIISMARLLHQNNVTDFESNNTKQTLARYNGGYKAMYGGSALTIYQVVGDPSSGSVQEYVDFVVRVASDIKERMGDAPRIESSSSETTLTLDQKRELVTQVLINEVGFYTWIETNSEEETLWISSIGPDWIGVIRDEFGAPGGPLDSYLRRIEYEGKIITDAEILTMAREYITEFIKRYNNNVIQEGRPQDTIGPAMFDERSEAIVRYFQIAYGFTPPIQEVLVLHENYQIVLDQMGESAPSIEDYIENRQIGRQLVNTTGFFQQNLGRQPTKTEAATALLSVLKSFDFSLTQANELDWDFYTQLGVILAPQITAHQEAVAREIAAAQAQEAARVENEVRETLNEQITAFPLNPMPAIFKPYGTPVDYQAGGIHTGIDISNLRVDGLEPPIFAVGGGVVVHVGPIYCDIVTACRGSNAIVIDHGGDLYSIYSHNSAASVAVGEPVTAGQRIGQQGNEGYSFGSHLHFEIHTGAPYSGNWQEPWLGGQFEDPVQYLPYGTTSQNATPSIGKKATQLYPSGKPAHTAIRRVAPSPRRRT